VSDERMFPVLWQWRNWDQERAVVAAGCPRNVPWRLLAPHEQQALRNHDQSLEKLASRGGLGPSEMVAVIEGRGLSWVLKADEVACVTRLLAYVRELPPAGR